MKKIILFALSLLFLSSFALASEVSIYFSSAHHKQFWHLNNITLNCEGDNYSTTFNFTDLAKNPPVLFIDEAWVKFNLFKTYYSYFQKYEWVVMDMYIGKILYPFGNVSIKPSKNISIFQPFSCGSDWMIQIAGEICNENNLHLYMADPGDPLNNYTSDAGEHLGFRWTTSYIKGLDFGASFRVRNAISKTYDTRTDYGIDLSCTIAGMVKFDSQAFNIDDGDDNTDDLDFWSIVSYAPGFQLPLFKKTIPYLGYFSKSGMEENNMIFGVNIKPNPNIFIKLEYNIDSLDKGDSGFTNCSDALCFQFGFTF